VVENNHHTYPLLNFNLLILNIFILFFHFGTHFAYISTLSCNLTNFITGVTIVNLTKSKLHIAVLAALPFMALASLNASATCTTGSAPSTDANTVTCTEGSSYVMLPEQRFLIQQ
jgi:hypothetical protein